MTVCSSDHPASTSLFIPSEPDLEAQRRVHAAISCNQEEQCLNDEEKLSKRWPVTCQVQIVTSDDSNSDDDDGWILWSLDHQGNVKTRGGDEYYIAITVNNENENEYCNICSNDNVNTNNKSTNKEVRPYTAVAIIEDRHDGSYRLTFSATPTCPIPPPATACTADCGGATLTIFFQYSCGIGQMAPPTKAGWRNGAYTHRRYDIPLRKLPPIRPYSHPNHNNCGQNIIDLSQYDLIVAYGDSTMEQFIRQRLHKKGKYLFQKNITQGEKICTGLNSTTVEHLLNTLERDKGDVLRDSTNFKKKAIMIGSCLWDILDSKDTVQGEDYNDHQQACRNYIREIRTRYPDVTILWKSPTAVHIHVVDLERLVVSKIGEAALFGMERIRYMSATRSKHLYRAQKRIIEEECADMEDVVFLDLYEASYLSADWLFPSDGRHYRPDWNRLMLQGFYPSFLEEKQSCFQVSSDGKGGLLLDMPKPYYRDPTFALLDDNTND